MHVRSTEAAASYLRTLEQAATKTRSMSLLRKLFDSTFAYSRGECTVEKLRNELAWYQQFAEARGDEGELARLVGEALYSQGHAQHPADRGGVLRLLGYPAMRYLHQVESGADVPGPRNAALLAQADDAAGGLDERLAGVVYHPRQHAEEFEVPDWRRPVETPQSTSAQRDVSDYVEDQFVQAAALARAGATDATVPVYRAKRTESLLTRLFEHMGGSADAGTVAGQWRDHIAAHHERRTAELLDGSGLSTSVEIVPAQYPSILASLLRLSQAEALASAAARLLRARGYVGSAADSALVDVIARAVRTGAHPRDAMEPLRGLPQAQRDAVLAALAARGVRD